MINENLLATYSLLSFIRESYDNDDKRDSLINVYVPIVKEALATKLRKNNGNEYKGKDYSEIQNWINEEFNFEIPIPILGIILPMVKAEVSDGFDLFGDHGFIIKSGCVSDLSIEYNKKKNDIRDLKSHYKAYCKSLGVEFDFENLINFIQDQKNRIFDKAVTVIDTQGYHVSKFIRDTLKRKGKYYNIICSIYLGGIIGSYFKFQVNEQVFDVNLLIDTNFYISLINLNTEESYNTCRQLYDLTIAMGFHYYILESTIEQIKILLNTRIKRISSKDFISAVDEADILSACKRLGYDKDYLEREKQHIYDNLQKLGVTIVYNAQIKDLISKAEKNADLKKLSELRGGNRQSALNDLIAREYVESKRAGKAIIEFSDVNCWFLNNSFSFNKREVSVPVWKRTSITASDLLVLLWLANPSQKFKHNVSTLAITSLSSNVLKYRSDKAPTHHVINKIQDKVARLQTQGKISQEDIAKLCVRMSEGCIDANESERILSLTSSDFLEYIEKIDKREDIYLQEHEENIELVNRNENLNSDLNIQKAENELLKMRIKGTIYLFAVILLYIIYRKYIVNTFALQSVIVTWGIDILYFLATIIGVNLIDHKSCLKGLKSFFYKEKIIDEIINRNQALGNNTH